MSWVFITPGKGSFTIGTDKYTLNTKRQALKNNVPIPGGSGTSMMALLGNLPYGQDANSHVWYVWNNNVWTPATLAKDNDTVSDTNGFLVLPNPAGQVATLASGGQIAFNGTIDTITVDATLLLEWQNTLWQEVPTPGKGWYSYGGAPGQWNGPTTDPRGGPTPPPPTGIYQSTSGKIYDPTGKLAVFKGIAVMDSQIQRLSPQDIRNRHPKCTAIRLAIGNENHGYQTPAFDWPTTKAWIDAALALNFFVLVDDHEQFGGTNPYTGSALNADLAYAKQVAAAYVNEPRVVPQSMNEPGTTAGLSAYHQAFNNAVRSTGNKNLIIHDIVGGNLPSAGAPSDNAHTYTLMDNWAFDFHAYNWMTYAALNASGQGDYNDQAQVNAWYNSTVNRLISWTTQADGTHPGAVCCEFGDIDYTPGHDQNTDAGGGSGTNTIVMCVLTQNAGNSQPSAGGFFWLYDGTDAYGWPNVSNIENPLGTNTAHGNFWDANA